MQTLLSIMNESNPIGCLKRANIRGHYVVINQITQDDITPTNMENKDGKIISVYDKGLSKSRNLALRNAKAQGVALLADNDITYTDNYNKIVEEAYKKYPDADVIAFRVIFKDKAEDSKKIKEGHLTYRNALTMSSVNISFKLNSIRHKGIHFDESFGAGTRNIMGEDNIFMSDCIKKGLRIYYVPEAIGTVSKVYESTWFKGYNKTYFLSRGAVFRRLSPRFYKIFILRFALLKHGLYGGDSTFLEALRYMLIGAKTKI